MSIKENTKLQPKPYNVKYIIEPTQAQLRELALKFTPAIMKTAYGNVNKFSRNKARRCPSAVVTSMPTTTSNL